jgi:hypothetical protein
VHKGMTMRHENPEREPAEQPASLKDATRNALLEGRVVLTAITTLFGFQLNVVFSEQFSNLAFEQRRAHLIALALNALAIGVVMLPPAYGRQAEPRQVSRRFIRLLSRAQTFALAPMLVSIAIDFQLIASMILGRGPVPTSLAVSLAVLFTIMWFVYPRIRAIQLESRGLGPANGPAREEV